MQAGNFSGRLFVATCWTAMLIAGAAAETSSPSPARADAATAAWGITGSTPQTGSSAHTSGRAFRAKIVVSIDKPAQEMKVFVDGVERYRWKVSTGTQKYDTPVGTYAARSMNKIWYSREWDDAPMPHAIFFTQKGHAIHGTEVTQKLGRPASHGCVRLAPENAGTLFALVKQTGLKNTQIVLKGDYPKEPPKVARSEAPKPEIKPAKKPAKAVASKKTPSSRKAVARSEPRKKQAPKPQAAAKPKPKPQTAAKQKPTAKPPVKPAKTYVDAKIDPYGIGAPRRLSRKQLRRLYYSRAYGGAARALPPPGYSKDPRALRGY
jgi:outer membrane biosynthesis protein TonB